MKQRNERPPIPIERAEEIRDLASSIGERNLRNGSVELVSILKDEDIDLVADDFGTDFAGLIECLGSGFIIYCNIHSGNQPNSARGRFTVSHELGHYFLDEHRRAIIERRMPSLGELAPRDLKIEREADLFASYLLMPRTAYQAAVKRHEDGMAGVVSLANSFRVSLTCAAVRYVAEDIVPSCLILRDLEGQVRWKWFSSNLWRAGYRKIKTEALKGSATTKILAEPHDRIGEIDATATTAFYAFSTGHGVNTSVFFQEEAISLGQFGVLTLLRSTEPSLPPLASILDQLIR